MSEIVVTDEELMDALNSYLNPQLRPTLELGALLKLVVSRLVETSTVFNDHEHPVHGVRTDSDHYYSAGSGHTGSPAKDSGFGCSKSQRIGQKRIVEVISETSMCERFFSRSFGKNPPCENCGKTEKQHRR